MILRSYFYSAAFIYLLAFLPELYAQTAKQTLTLKDAFKKALAQSENLKITEENIAVAEAQYRQLVAAIYPSISLIGQQRFRSSKNFGSVAGSGTFNDSTGAPDATRRGSLGFSQFESFVSLHQPLFNGFRDYLISNAAQAQMEAWRFDLERNKELLYLDLAEIYHQIQMYQGDLRVLKENASVLEKRISELKEFIELGKSRESEILSASSDLAELHSVSEQVKGLLAASMELLAFLVGIPSGELELSVSPEVELLSPLEAYLTRASERRDLKALELRAAAAEDYLKAAEREDWPALSLDGSAYPYEDPDRERDWEVLLRLEVPIYQGGKFAAREAEERANLRIAELNAQERTRQSEREVRIAYSNLLAAQSENKKLLERRDIAKKNYESQRRDYTNGIVSNLDVLQAIRQMHEAERALLDSETLVRLNRVRLEVQAGGILQ